MKLGILILVLALIYSANCQPKNCGDYITQILSSFADKKVPPISKETIFNSGKDLNDLGSYIMCTQKSDYKYITLELTATSSAQTQIGLCLPAYCQQSDLKPYENATAEFFASITQNKTVRAEYIDPELVYPVKEGGYYNTCMLCYVFLFLNFIGTVVSYVYGTGDKPDKLIKKTVPKEQIFEEQKFQIENEKTPQIEHKGIEQIEIVLKDDIEKQQDQDKQMKPQSGFIQFLRLFSFSENLDRLTSLEVKQETKEDSLKIFHGIRSLSIFWVIMGHEYLVRFGQVSNLADLPVVIATGGWTTLAAGSFFAVDVFFFLGGFLASVFILQKISKTKHLKPILFTLQMWIHRFLRIWPVYAFSILVFYYLSVHWQEGPIWNQYVNKTGYCQGTYWRNLLFIDIFFSHGSSGLEYCFGWGWYLANDFWIFLITPPLLILYSKSSRFGLIAFYAIGITSVCIAYGLAYSNDYHVNIPSAKTTVMHDFQDNFYYMPWVRISPYIMGIISGIIYRQLNEGKDLTINAIAHKIRTSILIRAIMYIVGMTLTSTIVFMVIPLQKDMSNWGKQGQCWYLALSKVFFILGLMLCITPALIGVKRDPIYRILGHPIWLPIAKISFCIYLIQLPVIYFLTYSLPTMVYLQQFHMLFFCLADIFFCIVVGGLLSLLVEIPLANLERMLLNRQK